MERLADKPQYYWDACAWIALIQQEAGRVDELSYVIEEAKKKKVEIWTSDFTLAEVYKRPIDNGSKALLPEEDTVFESYILQDFVTRVQVDYDVGVLARRLLRKYPVIAKPQDGIHLATALLNDLDEFHTYDRENLLGLTGQIDTRAGKKLLIRHPPSRPAPPQKPMPLFERLEHQADAEDESKKAASEGGKDG